MPKFITYVYTGVPLEQETPNTDGKPICHLELSGRWAVVGAEPNSVKKNFPL